MRFSLLFLILSLFMLLGACQQSSSHKDTNDSSLKETPIESSEKTPDYRQPYFNVLHDLSRDIGFITLGQTFKSDEFSHGIFHAELIDFDLDGYEELYILYKKSPHFSSANEDANGFYQEVWTSKSPDEEPKQIAFEPLNLPDYIFNEDVQGFGTVQLENGQTFIKMTSNQLISQMPFDYTVVYQLQNQQFKIVNELQLFAAEDWLYTKNGEPINEESYTKALEEYEENWTPLIKTDYLDDSLAIDALESVTAANDLLVELGNIKTSVLIESAPVEADIESDLLEALKFYEHLGYYNPNSPKAPESIFLYLLFSNKIQVHTGDDYSYVYSVKEVQQQAATYFGIELSEADFSMKEYESIRYEDGYIHLNFNELYLDNRLFDIQHAHKLKDNRYYLQYSISSIDFMNYSRDNEQAAKELFHLPLDQWPEEALALTTFLPPKYAVIDLSKDEPLMLYNDSLPLEQNQLTPYK